jgi:hypothetical protein
MSPERDVAFLKVLFKRFNKFKKFKMFFGFNFPLWGIEGAAKRLYV